MNKLWASIVGHSEKPAGYWSSKNRRISSAHRCYRRCGKHQTSLPHGSHLALRCPKNIAGCSHNSLGSSGLKMTQKTQKPKTGNLKLCVPNAMIIPAVHDYPYTVLIIPVYICHLSLLYSTRLWIKQLFFAPAAMSRSVSRFSIH